jgi:hypothetical protein
MEFVTPSLSNNYTATEECFLRDLRRDVTSMTSLHLGYPVPEGNKYRNLALQVGRVSKIEQNMLVNPWDSDLRKAALAMPGKN